MIAKGEFPISEYLEEALRANDMTVEECAARMGGDWAENLLTLELILAMQGIGTQKLAEWAVKFLFPCEKCKETRSYTRSIPSLDEDWALRGFVRTVACPCLSDPWLSTLIANPTEPRAMSGGPRTCG